MWFLLRYRKLATRNCNVCLEYEYDEGTGYIKERNGKLELRLLPQFPAPCRTGYTKCPKGTPENQNTFVPINLRAYEHYQECRAVGVFPDEQLVREHAAKFREIEEEFRLSQVKKIVNEAVNGEPGVYYG